MPAPFASLVLYSRILAVALKQKHLKRAEIIINRKMVKEIVTLLYCDIVCSHYKE